MTLPSNPPATTTPAAFKTWAQNVKDTLDDIIAGNIAFTGDIEVPDEAYNATTWNGSLEVPTKNAVRDKVEDILDGVTFTGDVVVPGEVYGVGWNGSNEAPTKNDVYDKIETIGAGSNGTIQYSQPTDGTTRASATLGSLGTAWTDTATTTADLPKVRYAVQISMQCSGDQSLSIALVRGGTIIDRRTVYTISGSNENSAHLIGIDNPGGAGTYTYEVYVASNSAGTVTVNAVADTGTAHSVTADGSSHMLLQPVATA